MFSQTYSCTLQVVDKKSNQKLESAYIFVSEINEGTISDEHGKCIFELPKGEYTFEISYVGYQDTVFQRQLVSDTTYVFFMQPAGVELSKVVITKQKKENVVTEKIDKITLNRVDLSQIPSMMGEADIIRSFSTKGGVQKSEGVQGMNVRGGTQEQNLILLDGAPVFNPSHLLGFFSVFPSEIIDAADLYKSAAPIEYGGRMSSVLDIETRSAFVDSISGAVSVGLLSSSVYTSLRVSDNSALRFSYRKSYLDLIVMPLILDVIGNNEETQPKFDFNDATVRYDYRINMNNILSFSFYSGEDAFNMNNNETSLYNCVDWGNTVFSARWKHLSEEDVFQTLTASHSVYDFNFLANQSVYSLAISTGISTSAVNYVYTKNSDSYTYTLGVDASYNQFNSGSISAFIDSSDVSPSDSQLSRSGGASIFGSYTKKYSSRFSVEYGFRFVPYAQLGPATEYTYDSYNELTDSVKYTNNEIMYSHFGFEPRISSTYILSSTSSLKAACVRANQNLHMVSLFSAALPADIWFPASAISPAQRGVQLSVGYVSTIKNDYSASFSVYGKKMNNLVEFKDGFFTLYNQSLATKIATGSGFSAGTEMSIEKNEGILQGGVSYVFSRSLRKFSSINDNNVYPASYDKPHNVSVYATYTITSHLSLSALWVYSSGRVYSKPAYRYFIDKNLINQYGTINNSRMPAYHRLDLGLDYTCVNTEKHTLQFNVSVYNAYNRTNSYYVYYGITGDIDNFAITTTQDFVGLFPVLPSCSLHFTF
ncbi:MAG: carboxypeptidase-like regulatory domain-containing protein [Bacteroidales bacterium]